MKPFIGILEEKTEDRLELSKGPKGKQKVGRNHPNGYEKNRSNQRKMSIGNQRENRSQGRDDDKTDAHRRKVTHPVQ